MPFKSKKLNYMEFINEIGINLFSFALYLLTPIVKEGDTRELIGWFLVGLTVSVMGINIIVIIFVNVKKLCMKLFKKKKKTK